MRPFGPTTDARGFTLFEVLVALTVSTIVSLAGWTFYRHELHDLTQQSANLDATEAMRAATGFLAREIRMAGYDPTGSALAVAGNRGIAAAGATTIHLEADVDDDGTIDGGAPDPTAESILYTYDAANRTILRTVAGVTYPLVTHVPPSSFSFAYLDALGNPLAMTGSPPMLDATARDAVATVVIRLGIETPTVTPGAVFETATRVAVRSRVLDRL